MLFLRDSLRRAGLVLLMLGLFSASAFAAVAEEQPPQKGGFLLVLAVWLSFFALSLTLGYTWGKARSIKFDDPSCQVHFQKYIARKISKTLTWVPERDPNGELAKLSATWSCRFCSGITAYVYDSSMGKHYVEPPKLSDLDQSNPPRNGISFPQVMKAVSIATPAIGAVVLPMGAAAVPVHAFAAPTTANAIPNLASLVGNSSGLNKIMWIGLAIFLLVSGFWLGYKWGYCDQPKITERLEKLLEKGVFWQGVANLHSVGNLTQSWTFETRNNVVLVKRASESAFANVVSMVAPGLPVPAPSLARPSLKFALPGGLGIRPLTGNIGSRSYFTTAPPGDLMLALQMAGEKALAERLKQQVGTSLGEWSPGFPLV